MKSIKFFDLKAKKPFWSEDYRIILKKGRRFAVTKAPSGIEAWRIVGANF